MTIQKRLAQLDWKAIEASLWQRGYAKIGPLLTAEECEAVIALYVKDEYFRSRIEMRHRGSHQRVGPRHPCARAHRCSEIETLGGAQPLAASIDYEEWPEVVGTLAGDDTVLIICQDQRHAQEVEERLRTMLEA